MARVSRYPQVRFIDKFNLSLVEGTAENSISAILRDLLNRSGRTSRRKLHPGEFPSWHVSVER